MAHRFVFRLQPVLRVRQRALEATQRVVAERLRRINHERGLIQAAHDQVRANAASARDVQQGYRLDPVMMRSFRAYGAHLSRVIAIGEQRLGEEQRALAAEREALKKASMAVKALEKLRERRFAQFTDDERRRNRLLEDEVARNVHARSGD